MEHGIGIIFAWIFLGLFMMATVYFMTLWADSEDKKEKSNYRKMCLLAIGISMLPTLSFGHGFMEHLFHVIIVIAYDVLLSVIVCFGITIFRAIAEVIES